MNDRTTAPAKSARAGGSDRILAELDALIEANRAEPSEALASELLDLRLRAVDALDTSPTRRVEPPRDPFPVDAVPEIEREALDPTRLARALSHHGALLVRGLLTPAQVDVLRADLDAMIATQLAAAGDDAPRPGGFGLGPIGNRQATESPVALAHLLDALQASGLTSAVTGYLGGRPVAIAERVRLRRSRDGLPWHQDAAFFGGHFAAVNSWIALTPCGVDRDGLAVIPRRVDEIIGGTSRTFGYGKAVFNDELVAELCGGRPIAVPQFEAGDALLFDEMTVHRTHVVRDATAPRDVAVCWHFSADRVPKREPVPWTRLVI